MKITCDESRCDPAYRLFNNRSEERAQLIRPDGSSVHEWAYHQGRSWHYAEMLDNGHLLVIDKDHAIIEIDRNSSLVWSFGTAAHHDFARKKDGNTYVLSGCNRVATSIMGERALYYDCLYEVSPGGEVVWSWFADEHAGELGVTSPYGADYIYSDWPHINTCEILPDTPLGRRDERFAAGMLLMCGRIIDTIWIVDPTSGAVVWTWGPGELIGPHMPNMLPNGNLLVYDNGSVGERDRGYSRLVEVDPIAGEIVWQFIADPPSAFFSPSRGSAERLANGNHLIAESDSGILFEVAPDGTRVWELHNQRTRPDGRPEPIYRVKPYTIDTVRSALASV